MFSFDFLRDRSMWSSVKQRCCSLILSNPGQQARVIIKASIHQTDWQTDEGRASNFSSNQLFSAEFPIEATSHSFLLHLLRLAAWSPCQTSFSGRKSSSGGGGGRWDNICLHTTLEEIFMPGVHKQGDIMRFRAVGFCPTASFRYNV